MRKLLVVTGGTKGIGRAVAERFLRADFDVATCARHAADLAQLRADLSREFPAASLHTHVADLSQKPEVEAFAAFVQQLDRPVGVLVHNAGYFVPGTLHDEADDVLEGMLRLNVMSAYYLSKRLLPDMLAARRGHLFFVNSIASLMAYPSGGAYAVTKHASHALAKVLRAETKGHGVRVTSVLPGATLTDSWAGTDLPPERFMPPADVADAIYAAYAASPRTVVEEVLLRPQEGDI